MQFTVSVKKFAVALGVVSRVANSRSSLPILSNLLIKAEKNRVCISATNLNIVSQVFIGSKVLKNGSITIPARLIQEYISAINEETVDLGVNNNKINISTKLHKTIINGTDAKEFPEMPELGAEKSWEIASTKLKKYFSNTIICASTDDTKPILGSVLVYTEDNKTVFAATDGYRLAEQKAKTTAFAQTKFIIPANTVSELIRVLPDDETVVGIKTNEQLAEFSFGDTKITTRLIGGSFPDYKNLIPKNFSNIAVVDKKELANTTKLAGLFARDTAGSINISTNEPGQELGIKTVASQTGQNESTIPAKVTGTADITINARYINDALSQISSETATISFNEKLQPCVIKGEDPDYLQVIMPLKS
ncbi:DNA polymerase III subunit beta [Candidatus Saccharibacteria bacterium RIFCSPHIGHO2_12_FULL_41_12]|nr:MAG: DNA polymerase III subunit beta [Candidatus Saccharibacteria bacterium RIFCSPHIGHO2_12_FULL_41_12]